MKKIVLILPLLLCAIAVMAQSGKAATPTFRLAANVQPTDYDPTQIVIKIKPEYQKQCTANRIAIAAFEAAQARLGASNVQQMFPNETPLTAESSRNGVAYVDLSGIYTLHLTGITGNKGIEAVANELLATGVLAYAEPYYIYSTGAFTPNDASISQQTYLTRINAFNAWDIALGGSQGDTTVIIGIVDSGTDTDHPDLASKIKINYTEIINGIDDDGDGYIDNRVGWDLAGADYNAVVEDKNPNTTGSNNAHGVHVAGCAAAATNNGVGVAGTGFKCKFLPVKCAADNDSRSNGSGYIIAGYQGIKYAADHGCAVINCSWGGAGGGQFGQDIVTYATINKNALVVAAAGNSGVDEVNYPASFDYAFSVAATNSNNDVKATFSTFNSTVDISTPGNGIYNTYYNNAYSSLSGTSMSSPITAGAAALVKSKYPTYTALQLGEKLRVTSDNHYTGSNLSNYANKLGKGRLNMFRALTVNSPSIRLNPIAVTDGNDGAFVAGEVLSVTGTFFNYLAPTTNLTATITAVTNASSVTIQTATINLGVIGTLASINNSANPFRVLINASAPANTVVQFKITYTDGTYTDFQVFDVSVNVDYVNVRPNLCGTTITSKGRTGYNGTTPTSGGIGFIYRDSSLLYEGGLMVGVSNTQVMNNVRGTPPTGTTTPSYDEHFISTQKVRRNTTNPRSELDLYGTFTDGLAPTPVGLSIDHKFYAWSTPGDEKYVIVEYNIKNTSAATLNNVWAGLFADWDIYPYTANKTNQDAALKLGYSYSTGGLGLYAGTKVLSATPFNAYGLDNLATTPGVVVTDTDGYSFADKYTTLSTSLPQAGTATTAGNDIHQVVSTGPFTIAANGTITVAFALLGADNLADIKASAAAAQIRYDNFVVATANATTLAGATLAQSEPNPTNDRALIRFILPIAQEVELNLYDINGKLVQTVYNGKAAEGTTEVNLNLRALPNGTYIYALRSGASVITKRLTVIH